MTRRFRALWLPGLAVTLAAQATLYLVILAGVRPWTILLDWYVFHSHHPLQFYVPFLLALPTVAATGSLWSRRQGGSPREVALVALFPAIAALGLILVVMTPLDILVDVVLRGSHTVEHTFCGTAWALVSMVLAPGVALALGFLAALVWWHHAPRAGARVGQPEAGRA
jgi:hypothetical protein